MKVHIIQKIDYFYYQLTVIARCKFLFFATLVMSFCICNQNLLSTHICLQHFGVWLLLRIFEKKRLNAHGFAREYLRSCVGYGPGRSVKRHGKSSSLHLKKNFLLWGCGFFMSDIISGGLLGHHGPLCMALGANRQVVVFR